MTAGEDILFLCVTCIRRVRIKIFLTVNHSSGQFTTSGDRWKEKYGNVKEGKRDREREIDEAQRHSYNLHYQSIITVIIALLSRLQLQNGLRSLKCHVFVSTA